MLFLTTYKHWALFLIVGMSSSIWSSCKREVDIQAPETEVIRFDPAPKEGIICGDKASDVFLLRTGQTLDFDLIFRDNEALSQYKIDIHSNFDCHGHARTATEDWSVLEVVDLSGTEQSISRSLKVPENATAGAYHFQIQAIDAAGNEDPLANYYDIQVVNTVDSVAPQLDVTEPSVTNLSLLGGEDIRFIGSVMDNYSLGEGGNGRLLLTYQRSNGGNLFEAQEIIWPESQGDRATFDFTYAIPTTFVTDSYEFVLSAYDGVNNESNRIRFVVEIEN